jgi:hypothetical protein
LQFKGRSLADLPICRSSRSASQSRWYFSPSAVARIDADQARQGPAVEIQLDGLSAAAFDTDFHPYSDAAGAWSPRARSVAASPIWPSRRLGRKGFSFFSRAQFPPCAFPVAATLHMGALDLDLIRGGVILNRMRSIRSKLHRPWCNWRRMSTAASSGKGNRLPLPIDGYQLCIPSHD